MRTPEKGDLTFQFEDMDSDARLRELILYISDVCATSETFGKIVLNKILWRADFEAYLSTGRSLTGSRYQSIEFGPAPKRMVQVLDMMKGAGDVEVRAVSYHGYAQQRVIALRSAKLSMFSGEEIALLNRVINECRSVTGKALSDASHGKAWRLGLALGAIPYEAAFLSDEPLTPYHEARAQELIAQYGWTDV